MAFEQVIESFKCRQFTNVSFGAPHICTATSIFQTSKSHIDIGGIAERLGANTDFKIRTQKTRKSKRSYRSFSNAVTVVFEKTKTIKIFVNGKMHVTGCTGVERAEQKIKELCLVMGWNDVTIVEKRLLMMNVAVKIVPKKHICLPKLYDIIKKEYPQMFVRYTPDIYQGLVIKPQAPNGRMLSIMCFYTGSFILSGITQVCELEHLFGFFGHMCDSMYGRIKLD